MADHATAVISSDATTRSVARQCDASPVWALYRTTQVSDLVDWEAVPSVDGRTYQVGPRSVVVLKAPADAT